MPATDQRPGSGSLVRGKEDSVERASSHSGSNNLAANSSEADSRSVTGSGGTGATGEDGSGGGGMTATQEYFLSELETTDSGSIGLVLRAIYAGGDVDRFMGALERKIAHWDRDIEKLCNYHYEGFIEAIRELVTLRKECHVLRGDVEGLDGHLRESCGPLLDKARELVAYRRKQRNIAAAVDNISLCLPMLEKYAKLQELMAQKRFYPALKTLELLEHTYMPQVEGHRFATKLMTSAVTMRSQIKDASQSEFTDFLENIRKVSGKIGEKAMRQTMEQYDMDSAASQKRRWEKSKLATKKLLATSPGRTLDGAADESLGESSATSGDDGDFSAQDMVDFGPVYRCSHIFTVLGQADAFRANYRRQRAEQAAVVLRAADRRMGRPEDFLSYFHQVLGFFIVEHAIGQTQPGLVTREHKDELWKTALDQLTATLNRNFGNCTDGPVMLKIKKLILVFALCLKGYGYGISSFYKLLQNFRDQYNEILMSECCANLEQLLRDDNYTPILVKTEREYREVLESFPFYQRGLEAEPFPKKFPFSAAVPGIYEQVKVYVRGCLRFMDHLGLTQSQVDETVRRYTNLLLERLSGSLKAFVLNPRLSLLQLIQITINMGYLEKSCEALERFVSDLTSGGEAVGAATLRPGSVRLKEDVFRDARSSVEQRIDEALAAKIGEFLELASYDWEMGASTGRASDYIQDLVNFLSTTFKSFTNLPLPLARHTCLQACKALSSALLRFLTGPEVKAVSAGGLEQFSLDVMQCELFAAQCPVPGYEDGTLTLVFADLRQLLDLFLDQDWSGYLADYGNDRNKYARVPPASAAALLEKLVELEKRKATLFGKAKDKDRRKLLDTVLKQLRGLQHS